MSMYRFVLGISICALLITVNSLAVRGQQSSDRIEYRVLATNKTSTMQKELNEGADMGLRFEKAMGGSSTFGGSEVVVVMSKRKNAESKARYEYRLLATNKTSTMQKELQDAADAGFEYCDQTVFDTAFAGAEVVVILEKDREGTPERHEYKLLATNKTSTMQKELQEAGEAGFQLVGVTVSKSTFGGKEVVSILRRQVAQ